MHVLPAYSLLGLSFPPIRYPSSSSVVLILDGLAPPISLLSFSSFKVSSFRERTKGSYSLLTWPSPSKIFCVCTSFHSSQTSYRSFQYPFEQYPILHPIGDLHLFPPLIMPWVLPEANYFASYIHCYLWRHYHNWKV